MKVSVMTNSIAKQRARHPVRITLALLTAMILMGFVTEHAAQAQVITDPGEYAASRAGAQTFATDYCPGDNEMRIADYMWIRGKDGTLNVTVVNGGNRSVALNLYVYTTFCANWPTPAIAGAERIGLIEQGTSRNRLTSVPGTITYGGGPQNKPVGQRYVTEQTLNAYLDTSGWSTGRKNVCTYFATWSPQAARVEPSPSACFTINFTLQQRWSVRGESYVTNVTQGSGRRQGTNAITNARPGNRLDWAHDMRNNGPDDMDRTVYYNIDRTGYVNGWNTDKTPTGNARGDNGQLFVNIGSSAGNRTSYTVTQNDVGNRLCQRIAWRDRSWNQAGVWGMSNFACALVPFSYSLTPSMTILPSTVIEPGEDTIEVNGGLRNSGPTKSRQAPTMITRMQIPKGTSLPTATTTSTYTGGDAMQAACAYFRPQAAGMKRCDVQAPTPGGTEFASNYSAGIPGGQYSDDISGLNLAVGDKVCYVASVNLYSATSAANSWRHSPVRCAEVAKSPKVQIKGGSLYAGRAQPGGSGNDDAEVITGIGTKKVNGTNRVYGSWIEYGIFATGAVDSASGATLAGKDGADIAMQALKARNPLTFENRSAVGEFGDLGTIPNLRAKFTSASRSCSGLTLGGAASGVYTCSNTATLSGEVALGKSLIIKAPRIDITGDIRYASGSISSLKDIPQLVLISDNITITGNVGTVDAWLIGDSRGSTTNGWVVTCPDTRTGSWSSTNYTGGLTDTVCANQLQVNGPVMANKLFLRRTAGSSAAEPNAPAEVFNMRADAYLWAQNYGGSETSIEATYTRDLAPRF